MDRRRWTQCPTISTGGYSILGYSQRVKQHSRQMKDGNHTSPLWSAATKHSDSSASQRVLVCHSLGTHLEEAAVDACWCRRHFPFWQSERGLQVASFAISYQHAIFV